MPSSAAGDGGNPIQTLTSALLSHLPFSPFQPKPSPPDSPSSPAAAVALPLVLPIPSFFAGDLRSERTAPRRPRPSSVPSLPPPRGVRIDGLGTSAGGGGSGGGGGGGGGPAFVGQVFTMLDPSGNGLMAVTTRFDIPFLSKRTPEWLKKMFSTLMKGENGPVFRFFMDLNDAVSYVKRLNVPTGMVGACRLDVAYEHFKEKPHMFQFVPNEKQVKAANKLLKTTPHKGRRRKLGGVPVFTAQNLNIAIATNNGIRWYTPYFFDKNLLDNILEASMDQHFDTMIQNRHMKRRKDVIDDSLTAEMMEESADSVFEPPEVQELMDEIGHAGIPLSVISKAAEIQFLDVVDKLLLGNKWLRKASGIQPKFPYVVESFEERSAASLCKAAASTSTNTCSVAADCCQNDQQLHAPELNFDKNTRTDHDHSRNHTSRRLDNSMNDDIQSNPLLPKITMVGISMGEGGQMSKASLKKTMEDLTKELEQASQKSTNPNEERDPLFVANVGDYSRITRINSTT